MNDLTMSFANVIHSNGISIAIAGMLIVFLALTIIALAISMIPKLLPLLERIFPEEHAHHTPAPVQVEDHEHEKVLAAIAYALFRRQTGSLPAK